MKDETRRALNQINARFYVARADEFCATRRRAWGGQRRIADGLPSRPLRILDVGCGDGRLLAALRAARGPVDDYIGVDASPPLLEAARLRWPDAAFETVDLVERDPARALSAGPFDIVGAFGLMHHVPGVAQRRALICALADRLADDGRLVITVWRFADRERFRRRCRPWPPTLDADDLDPGDHLLAWGPIEGGSARYCHHADDEEVAAWLADAGLEAVEQFEADGQGDRQNLYIIARPHRWTTHSSPTEADRRVGAARSTEGRAPTVRQTPS